MNKQFLALALLCTSAHSFSMHTLQKMRTIAHTCQRSTSATPHHLNLQTFSRPMSSASDTINDKQKTIETVREIEALNHRNERLFKKMVAKSMGAGIIGAATIPAALYAFDTHNFLTNEPMLISAYSLVCGLLCLNAVTHIEVRENHLYKIRENEYRIVELKKALDNNK